jgi:predicted short-subunit dehydrogenase-like oxidoreductase (DUF2520 family)
MERLVIIGPGRVGLALGYALVRAEAVESLVYFGRHPEPPPHPLFSDGIAEYRYGLEAPAEGTTAVFLTVPDAVLEEMAEVLAARGDPPPATPAFHCAGALGAEPLASLHARGYRVGTLHPMQPVPYSVAGADRLIGASFALSGEPEALAAGRRIVSALGGRAIQVPTTRRPLYHAAAVMASNYVLVLLDVASRLLVEAGASPEEAEEAVVGLARGTLENAAELGLDHAPTGPIRRGDSEVVDLHLRALGREDASLYAELGLRALDRSRSELAPEAAGRLEKLLERYR